jgi:D-glycero-D-manno-heptose 1,7-bisphosphate phosphatase
VRRAVFLDRDGVLNANVLRSDGTSSSPLHPDDFHLLPGVLEALAALGRGGYLLFLVSNQPGYAKGETTLEALHAIHARLLEALAGAGIGFTRFYYCHHQAADACACRKPSPHFLLEACAAYELDRAGSWLIGDRDSDVLCGRAAGARTIRVGDDRAVLTCEPHRWAADLPAAARAILDEGLP